MLKFPYSVEKRWMDIVSAIKNKKKDPKQYDRVYIGSIQPPTVPLQKDSVRNKSKGARLTQRYILDGEFFGVAFTLREAQVMLLIIGGLTNKKAGEVLGVDIGSDFGEA